MENIVNSRKEIGDYIFVSKYARTVHGKKETWDQSIDRVMEMHWRHLADDMTISDSSLDDLSKEMSFAEKLYRNQVILGAQRALQYGGNTLLKHHARNYNCAGSYANRISFFQELMYLLLCGSGTGYSVQKVHVNQLPKMKGVDMSKQTTYVIDDSIEGWSHAVNALIESHYFGLPEVVFDSSRVRPKGAFITGGFRAPGPEPLMKCLSKMGKVLGKIRGRKATPFEVHRLACLIADAVISGGIRRSALLCQFDADDREMLTCKTGGWFSEFPELARANNSAIILPSTPKEVYENIFSSIKQFGEPGIIFSFHPDIVYNPCVEVSGYPQIEINGEIQYGWFFCNLTEINGSKIKTKEEFFDACRGASVLGTIQASYTSFKVLTKASRLIAERDALIGVGITGMCENPEILFNPEIQDEGARLVQKTNVKMSRIIGINPAARCTVVKPSGNSSQLLGCTSSGIHKFPFKRFIRNIQAANTEQALRYVKEINPMMVKPSVYDKEVESVISFPVELDDNVLTSEYSSAVDFLEMVKMTKAHWIENGTNFDHQFYKKHPKFAKMRMNVSNTCMVKDDEWDEVKEYVWNNRDVFSGISFLPKGGDLLYPQAPYTSVLDEKELAERYGAGAILAGGLIVDGLAVFNDDLWLACDVAMGRNTHHLTLTDQDITNFILSHLKNGKLLVEVNGVMISDVNAISSHLQSLVDKKIDWVRRFKKFAGKYLGGDLTKTEFCLKHVSLFHRWQKLKDMKHIDWSSITDWDEEWVDAGSTVAQACSGGSCELK
jgi:ribonucleoside-triphosphate reductase (thioredoxin)